MWNLEVCNLEVNTALTGPPYETAVTAVTAGGVVGALLFIIGIEFLVILLLWKFRRLVVIIHTNSV